MRWIHDLLGPSEEAVQRAAAKRKYLRTQEVERAISLRELGRFDEALEILTRASREAPGDYPLISVIGNTLVESGRWDEAERYLRAALQNEATQVDPVAVAVTMEWWAILGEVAFKRADYREAVSRFSRAADMTVPPEIRREVVDFERARVLTRLADAHLNTGNPAAARRAAFAAYQLQPEMPMVKRGLGVVVASMMTPQYWLNSLEHNEVFADVRLAGEFLDEIAVANPGDYEAAAMAAYAFSCVMLRGEAGFGDSGEIKECTEAMQRIVQRLSQEAGVSVDANTALVDWGNAHAGLCTALLNRDSDSRVEISFDGVDTSRSPSPAMKDLAAAGLAAGQSVDPIEVLGAFTDFMDRHPLRPDAGTPVVRDASELPFEKQVIKTHLARAISLPWCDQTPSFITHYLCLAHFQSGVGRYPSGDGAAAAQLWRKWQAVCDAEVATLKQELVKMGLGHIFAK